MPHYVVHYKELGIKGQNRAYFERRLADSIRRTLSLVEGPTPVEVAILPGRLLVSTAVAAPETGETIARLPAVAFVAQAVEVKATVEAIAREAIAQSMGLGARTFRVHSKRADKWFHLDSLGLNREIGAAVAAATSLSVDLENPDHTVYIEMVDRRAFVYTRKLEGIGGLPLGSSGRVVALLSGGIDSPVAAYQMIRRGCEVVLAHFHNHGRHENQVRSKILDLAQALARYQLRSRVYLIPFADFQAAIVQAVPASARMISYRRFMLEVGAALIAREEAMAFVTGDSLGQVASQTLSNLTAIGADARYPILSPLIGNDKEEIIRIARRIGTYDISVRPYDDCCSFLVARHPDTRVNLAALREHESRIPTEELQKLALDAAEIHDVGPAPAIPDGSPAPAALRPPPPRSPPPTNELQPQADAGAARGDRLS